MPDSSSTSLAFHVPPCASAVGDDEFGLWCEIEVAGGPDARPVVQRFRWIEPGEFLMGSPEDEPERYSDEGPQHRVALTRGFWLGDTACTQTLWSAVMGENPSGFKGADLPVEQVSWEDVQEFLSKLEALLPGCGASLPTEAEWEYACRAGTTTPFSFGAMITPEQVNYDGNSPYAGGAAGQYREKTVPVKSLSPNGWGLFEMHGNVREWCADGLRTYAARDENDPVGPGVPPEAGGGGAAVPRVVRGGAWFFDAGWVRSAYRGARPPGDRDDYLGFRFSLRSMGPSPVQPARGAGSVPPGGRPIGRR